MLIRAATYADLDNAVARSRDGYVAVVGPDGSTSDLVVMVHEGRSTVSVGMRSSPP